MSVPIRPAERCTVDRRREQVRAVGSNGLDYLEVGDDQRTLRVFFIGRAPRLRRENVRIDGAGRRSRPVSVTAIQRCEAEDADRDDCLLIRVNQPGDYSTYVLRLVERDEHGRPGHEPLAGLDPRYAALAFSFKVHCPTGLDCAVEEACPPPALVEPAIDYLAKDYASFRQVILDRLALLVPDWKERHVPDLGIALVELLAYVGDYLSYEQDAVATEAYLDTARRRISVRRHARLVDYALHEGCNARAWVTVRVEGTVRLDLADTYFVTHVGNREIDSRVAVHADDLRAVPGARYEAFEPLAGPDLTTVVLREAHNAIRFYTWGDEECCLPAGATAATLLDAWLEPADGGGGPAQAQQAQAEQAQAAPPQHAQAEQAQAPQLEQAQAEHEQPEGYRPEPEPEPVRALGELHIGDVLIFEEVIGARTGNPADADPTHRHAVRLTKVTRLVDELYDRPRGRPVVDVEWAEEDALPFPLCLSALVLRDGRCVVAEVSVARGNVLLVDHGRTVEPECWDVPAGRQPDPVCREPGEPTVPPTPPARFRPRLRLGPLTHRNPWPGLGPATAALATDPRTAEAAVSLVEQALSCAELALPRPEGQNGADAGAGDGAGNGGGAAGQPAAQAQQAPPAQPAAQAQQPAPAQPAPAAQQAAEPPPGPNPDPPIWLPRRDLLASGALDRHFVAEIENEGHARLRFGTGDLGRRPEPGTSLTAHYRVGNGSAGNVGAETIVHLVSRRTRLAGVVGVRNPLPARGGVDPEPIADARLFAPAQFRADLQRAVVAEDYARLAERHPRVQRAAASLRWTGSWYVVHVGIDALGGEADERLLAEVEALLYRYRRIGHDLVVRPARTVPLELALTVCVLPDALRGQVRAALLDALGRRALPDGRRGFFHPDALTFGDDVYVSQLVAAAMAVEGVENAVVTRLERLLDGPRGELDAGVLRLDPLEVARLDNDPAAPQNGRLTLNLRGGR